MDFVVREEKCKASDFGVQLMTEEKSGRSAKFGVSVQDERISTHVDSSVSNIAKSLVSPKGSTRFPVSKASSGTPLVSPQCFVCKCNNNVDCNHAVAQCQTFRSMSPFERRELVFSARRCFNCLGSHLVVDCASNSDCRKCEGSKIGKQFLFLHNISLFFSFIFIAVPVRNKTSYFYFLLFNHVLFTYSRCFFLFSKFRMLL